MRIATPMIALLLAMQGYAAPRSIPEPAPGNPGNVFYLGQAVNIPIPDADQAVRWELRDVDAALVLGGEDPAPVIPTKLNEPGWFELRTFDRAGAQVYRTALAILEPLTAPVPLDSPICVDAGVSWFARDKADEQAIRLRLAALTGANWIRDRFTWQEIMPAPNEAAPKDTTFDSAARITAAEGLQLLQTYHSTPLWARDPVLDPVNPGKRFPRDLGRVHDVCALLAKRYAGEVAAWEPWNEAEITGFGGHLINEIVSYQKAAWWGFKQTDPSLTVCAVPTSTPGTPMYHEGLLRNEAAAYFDTLNFHDYSRPAAWADTFQAPLNSARGKPVWLTECGIKVNAETEAPWGDLNRAAAMEQARFIPVSFATSLYAGVDRHFFFLLGNYIERTTQFGVIRHDFTPRPGYAALANVGRMLSGAKPLGRHLGPAGQALYAFRAQHQGTSRDVLVAWAPAEVPWPMKEIPGAAAVRDCFGRVLSRVPEMLGPNPVFVVLGESAAQQLPLEAPPAPMPAPIPEASPVVMQVEMPQDSAMLQKQAYQVAVNEAVDIPVRLYNFGKEDVQGELDIADRPEGWQVSIEPAVCKLPAGGAGAVKVTAQLPRQGRPVLRGGWVTVRGAFDDVPDSVLAFRLAGEPGAIEPEEAHPISSILDPDRWEENIVPGAHMKCSSHEGGLLIEMDFPDVHPWCYPILQLEHNEKPPHDADGLALTTRLLAGDARVRVQFQEEGGAFYIGETDTPREGNAPHRVTVFFSETNWRAATAPDPDGELTPSEVSHILVGVNARPESRVRLWIGGPAWVRY